MRIGLSTSVIQRGKTGIAQYVFGLLRGLLPQLGSHKLVLFVLDEDRPLFGFLENSVEVVRVPEDHRPPMKNILWHQAHLPALARRHRLDLLHVPSYRRLLWRKPCPLVATIHDLAPFKVERKYDWMRMLYGRTVVPRLAHRQDAIIAISRNTAADIDRFLRLPAQRVTVIQNGVDHERFFPGDHESASQAVARKHGLPHPFFLYLARLEHPAKNHVRLVQAFEEYKAATRSEWHLVFGGSDWHGAEAIHAAIRGSPCATDIHCLGFVPEPELPDLYRAAGAFVYPSLYEGFGLPPIEAMACGCPVIASERGSLGEVLGEAAAKVDPEDLHSMARQLFILATDASVRNQLRAAGFTQARRFDWKRTALETLGLYQRVVGEAAV
jgi:glycosyltransferase involved in cell wall biosynthesis